MQLLPPSDMQALVGSLGSSVVTVTRLTQRTSFWRHSISRRRLIRWTCSTGGFRHSQRAVWST
jgi:hypothetical protein